ncbi:MogA/MoaB family molybdenum cofactor biosynthesis protein [Deinococcus humi]|uniref:Molybdenum cofactor biosynthesis protein B n=1 Tax=Deinococcus humi TaxID=662880 RepID=A0A7W8JT21_9DEIO|nr:molybdenum cofactor biosynthesis protein B [Deinococcus humi]MBB5362727.1 molybdenum cofactor biosynthesis protein B [Deinococcus humi]GGO30963.1 molybdenum cofactor biosynthesis protein [Deinococcus humi]
MTDASQQPASQQHRAAAPRHVRVAVLTISDTRTPETDTSGQYLLAELKAAGHHVAQYRVVRDDAVEIRTALVQFVREATVVLTSGGTGLTGRDVTVPVVESMLTKAIPGFGELFRMLSYQQVGGAAMLSRALGGLCRGSAIFAMPGSLNAVRTAWEGILRDEIGHLAFEIERHGQPGVVTPAGSSLNGQVAPVSPEPSAVRSPTEGKESPEKGTQRSTVPAAPVSRLGRHKKEPPL